MLPEIRQCQDRRAADRGNATAIYTWRACANRAGLSGITKEEMIMSNETMTISGYLQSIPPDPSVKAAYMISFMAGYLAGDRDDGDEHTLYPVEDLEKAYTHALEGPAPLTMTLLA